ncbi:L-threonylcarbamoyladenylate synthase [Plantibacter sp. YIM 135249]|uniref:L-threonylcarbamoyladenylate synthase n=1 Tax=Plantibacter sp. YIM 135249 TaxID=3423918 RepID=UPI003D34BBCF
MPQIFDCLDQGQLLSGMRLARTSLGRGELVVLPTDTVYGVAADAFSPAAVQRLLDAKGRTRQSPPPVLVPGVNTLEALADTVPDAVRQLVEAFWPGGLTIVLNAQPSLAWDLGETAGTVALRMPANPITLELLQETGPLAVSSANLTGEPAASSAAAAEAMLGESVAVYLDGGPSGEQSSTIIDATALGAPDGRVTILRDGAVTREQLHEVIGDLLAPAAEEPWVKSKPARRPKAVVAIEEPVAEGEHAAGDTAAELPAAPAKSPARKPAARKPAAAKTPAVKAPAAKAPAVKASAAKAPAVKAPAAKAPAVKAPAVKAPAAKAPAAKAPAAKAPAAKAAAAAKAPAAKAPAAKAPAAKAPAAKAPAAKRKPAAKGAPAPEASAEAPEQQAPPTP